MSQQNLKTKLGYTDAHSDKVYIVELKESEQGWECVCTYGKRYNPCNVANKTKGPVLYGQAKEAYDKVIAQKMKKGYELEPI